MLKRIKKGLSPYYHSLRKYFYKGQHIYLIYSMGKVGSASIYTSLKRIKPYSDIFHVHFLSSHWLDHVLPGMHEYFHTNISLGKNILKHIERNPNKRIKMITLVREPVSRAVSEVFQNWRASYNNIDTVPNEKLLAHIKNNNFDYPLNWFDTEFLGFTAVDIYQLEFDKQKGYAIHQLENFDLVCIKLESLNKVGESVLKKFIGEEFKLLKANTSAKKRASDKYQEVKKDLRLKVETIDTIYNSKFIKHFYTDAEISIFKERWSEN